ncbi:unnamed protein product [Hermetia illucens]|uniref:DUF4773 domain-containing protein n=2 Tax=Hermetia illucens TaxID=343691 RepID=A0A7R8YTV9_HERIL|nr:unnamed protein product [Hermetia illucens]
MQGNSTKVNATNFQYEGAFCKNRTCAIIVDIFDNKVSFIATVDIEQRKFELHVRVNGLVYATFHWTKPISKCIQFLSIKSLNFCVKIRHVQIALTGFTFCLDAHAYEAYDFMIFHFPCLEI